MRTSRSLRHVLIAIFCAGLASCSIMDKEPVTARVETGKAKAKHMTAATPSKARSYGFSARRPMMVAMNDPDAANSIGEDRSSYRAGAPYVCSPSGFGRKAQCFQR